MANVKEKKSRTRSGCLNCRRRRRKCDEAKPTCFNCSKRNEVCERGIRLSFRKENAQTLEDHEVFEEVFSPSVPEHEGSHKRRKTFEIVDITNDVIDQCNRYSPSRDLSNIDSPIHDMVEDDAEPSSTTDLRREQSLTPRPTAETLLTPSKFSGSESIHGLPSSRPVSQDTSAAANDRTGLPLAGLLAERLVTGSPSETFSTRRNTTESAAQNLLFFRQMQRHNSSSNTIMTPYTATTFDMSPPFSYPMDQITPESFLDDGIFLPGSTYQELHATLRQHLIEETNSGAQTRQNSPPVPLPESEERTLRQNNIGNKLREQDEDEELLHEHTPPLELSSEEEYRLWKNWFDEIAGWLDKFDNHRHFRHTLPIMAQSCDHLRYSMLAVSARQFELKRSSKPTDQSLALYQQAIHALLPRLHTRSTAVIASCVVLCVLEMLSCSPKAWRRHLDGCANLMQTVGITGFSGGIEQALFWCFARMDVCGGLIDSMKTLIPVNVWASKIDMDADIGLFRANTSFHMYANHAVYLCAQVVELLSDSHDRSARLDGRSFTSRWWKIWRYVQDWETKRPSEILPVVSIPVCPSSPFPTILYSNPAAISGNQLYHTACILLLQQKPASVRLTDKPRSVQWHARQVCGISLSHDDHGAWTNSIQPLWIAGKCISRPEEQKLILNHLKKIESESGWGTHWRMQDLKEYWDIEYGSYAD